MAWQMNPLERNLLEMLQKYILKYILFSMLPKNIFQNSQFLSNWEASEMYISLSFLYKLEAWEAYISLNIDIFYIFLSRNVWNR